MHPDEGLLAILRIILLSNIVGATVRLFTDPAAVDAGTEFADLTEATFPGYAAKPVLTIAWPAPVIDADPEAETDSPTIIFTRGAGAGASEDIVAIGVVVVDEAAVERIWYYKEFDEPVTVAVDGDDVRKKLNFSARNY